MPEVPPVTGDILLVEDEQTIRQVLQFSLGKQHNVRTAANGEEAVDRVVERIPDLIVSDIMMPRMDGFALLHALRSHPETRVIPFIFLAAKADKMSRLKALRAGVDDYVTKPFDLEHLVGAGERITGARGPVSWWGTVQGRRRILVQNP